MSPFFLTFFVFYFRPLTRDSYFIKATQLFLKLLLITSSSETDPFAQASLFLSGFFLHPLSLLSFFFTPDSFNVRRSLMASMYSPLDDPLLDPTIIDWAVSHQHRPWYITIPYLILDSGIPILCSDVNVPTLPYPDIGQPNLQPYYKHRISATLPQPTTYPTPLPNPCSAPYSCLFSPIPHQLARPPATTKVYPTHHLSFA